MTYEVFLETSCTVQGDLDCDGEVGLSDLEIFCLSWLSSDGQELYNPYCNLSFPQNETIDLLDFSVFAGEWLK